MRSLRLTSLIAVFFLLGCARRMAPPTQALEDAASRVNAEADAFTFALAGFHSLLMEGDAQKAATLFDDAIAKNPAEPLALMAQTLMAQRSAVPQKALAAAFDLLERAPTHPLAPAAARLVLDLGAVAKSHSTLVRERVPILLALSQQPDTAHLLRTALANAYLEADEVALHAAMLSDMGIPTSGTLVGPFSPWHVLVTADATAPEKNGSLENLGSGPFGPLTARAVHFADGRISLGGEPPSGDVYLYAVDVTVPEAGRFILRTITSMDHVATLDGTVVLSRLTAKRPASTLSARVVKLEPGKHRLMVRMARETQVGNLTVALHRLDAMPAALTFSPAIGAAPNWAGVSIDDDEGPLYATGESIRAALEPDLGDALARFLAARDAAGRDGDGSRALLAGLPSSVNGPAVAVLRAEVFLQDRTVPTRVSRGRATRDLEAALTKDPGYVAAKMMTAHLALEDGRHLDALDQARAARDAHTPPGAPVLLLLARVELALGLDAAAVTSAREAETVLPGVCEALLLQYDVARKRDAVVQSDELLKKTSHCAGALARAAEHLRAKGDVPGAITQWESFLARDEGQVAVAISLTGLYLAEKRFDDAVKLLSRLRLQWPRNPALPKTLGDVFEVAGRDAEALAAREDALALDGADLQLRRAVVRQKTGKEILADYAISTEEALKSYEAAPGSEDATSSFVLDAAAIQAFPDGSMVDRVHIIQKALDQQGVQEVAEVEIPPGAIVLSLRTLKPNGRTLEPEHIEGKTGTSLPGVQVGDLVEYEYLLAHPTRGPAQSGFTASAFYFQVAQQPNARSSYVVIAPKGSGLTVDAHNVKAPQPQIEGDYEVLRHEERRVPAYIPEPLGPPSGNEWLPFVSVGSGQRGNEGVVSTYADVYLDKGLITWEVEAFARNATKDIPMPLSLAGLQAVNSAVQHTLSGRDAGLQVSAASSLAQERGSRVWLLKAALESLHFDVRLVAVRAFTADPAPYIFPNESLLPYICLRVRLPDGQLVWLDPFIRFAPFGQLPEFALGSLEAYVLPEPGRPLEKTTTPERSPRPGKTVVLDLSLNEEGQLSGKGVETYSGFEAAQVAEALEAISPEQRDQALQSALARYFGGADLSHLRVDMPREVGANVTVSYEFVAHHFARAEGPQQLIAASLTYPAQVGRRFLAMPSRTTPLFIDASEKTSSTATLTLPKGWVLRGPLAEIKLSGPSGEYVRHETQQGAVVKIDEEFRLNQSRIAPKQYEIFGQFAGEVDLVQQRDLLFEKKESE